MLPLCKTYAQTFSSTSAAKSIEDHSFPCVKRQTTSCDGNAWLQQGSRSPYINSGEDPAIIARKNKLTTAELEALKTPEGIVDLNQAGIELAVERRIALFFHQAILCHNMPQFEFTAKGADGQIGSSPQMQFSATTGEKTVHKREAAHSSTIPTLIAKKKGTAVEFVYLKGGSSHAQHNATIGMHECVNGADELIDGKADRLRASAVKIINKVAGGLDPVAATREFLDCFLTEVRDVKGALGVQDPRKLVLERYEAEIIATQAVAHDSGFFDHLMGVQIQTGCRKEQVLRQVVFKKRYDVIRLQEVVESRIGKRIDTFMSTAAKTERAFVEHILIKEYAASQHRQVVEKLLCKSAAVFEDEYLVEGINAADLKKKVQAIKGFRTRVENIRTKFANTIGVLKTAMEADFKELEAAELTYRSGLFADLRWKVNSWTQAKFCLEYRKKTGKSISRSWVSRIENLSRESTKAHYKTPINQRRRLITLSDAQGYARALDVDVGLFLPGMFTS